MKLSSLLALAASSLLALTHSAHAVVYWNNNFNSEVTNSSFGTPNAGYSTGSAPVTTGAFDLNGNMSAPTYAANSNTAGGRGSTVMAPGSTGFSSNSVGMYSHPFQYGQGADQGRFNISHTPGVNDPLTGTTTGEFEFGFKLCLVSTAYDTSSWTTKPAMTLNANYWDGNHAHGGDLPLLSFSFSLDTLILTSSTGAPEGPTLTTVIATGLTALTPVSIAAHINMDLRTFTVSVDGSQIGGTYYLQQGFAPDYGIGGYAANGGASNTSSPDQFTHFYDDIYFQTAAIPEPTIAGLIGVSALLLVRRRKR